jgi:threonine dehydrogenase-like Zn-dependent dehydrogenase
MCDQPPHLFGGFADYLYLAPDVLATKISDALPAEAAVLIGSVMANGFQWAIRRGGVKMGDAVLIQGPGQQGLACAFAARHAGAAKVFITGLARDLPRLELAKKFGAHRTINVAEENVVEVIREETNGEMCDVAVDVSGDPTAIRTALDCLHRQATLVLAGLTGDDTVTPLLLDKLVWGEIRLQGCFITDNDATEAAFRLIEATKFPVQEMVSHIFPLQDTEQCIRAVGGELPEMFPTKALINPALG